MCPNMSACCLSLLVLLHCAGADNLQIYKTKFITVSHDVSYVREIMMMEMFSDGALFCHRLWISCSESSSAARRRRGGSGMGAQTRLYSELPSSSGGGPRTSATRHLAGESVLARLFKELTRTSKRPWSRYRKGGMRSCFGVRLERIGSFSGLGC
ncbi:hypothetical protein KUCAC02_012451 [Chaenocephalus aceratus]|uniref:Uncharacterized protein n=1 Tax=Chaenocephalus aceratus TaxID=36190 RepID=A0ACB9XCA8_CHAAC|nr:hypothetical protein KUCAC02_012451 [Chaenocephalus aceratus]